MRPIDRPILIVGAPRSGTTLVYKMLAKHPDLAWISNVTKKVPTPLWALKLWMLLRRDHIPREGGAIWSRFDGPEHEARGAGDVTEEARRYLHDVVRNTLEVFDKTRFMGKCPGNSLRIPFLHAVFPDAVFVHVLRDGRAVTQSLMRSREFHKGEYWGNRHPGWQDLRDLSWAESSALQWKASVETIRAETGNLPPGQFLEVKYEDFVRTPIPSLRTICDSCGLAWDDRAFEDVEASFDNKNFRWGRLLQDGDEERIDAVIGDLQRRLGYPVTAPR